MDKETAKQKVAKLMAMATDGRGNEFEAENALRMAEALMRKHGIDAAEVQARTGNKPVYNWTRRHIPAGAPEPVHELPAWYSMLTLGIARFTDCKAEISIPEGGAHGICIAFSGDEIDVEYAAWLAKHLRDDCRRQARVFVGTRAARETFRKAYALRMQDRMRELRKERNKALQEARTSTGTALMVVDQKIAARNERFGEQKTAEIRASHRSVEAFAAGSRAADAANIHRPLSNSGRAAITG